MLIFEDNSYSIGKTPLIRLNRIAGKKAVVLAKIEGRNPAYSVKCRVGAAMVWDAERSGKLRPGMDIIEPTSGNTGIALAFTGAARGYKVTLTMPETMSIERRKILRLFGARIELTDGSKGMIGAIERARTIMEGDPERFYMPQQFENPANPDIHMKTTGPEIWNDTDGKVDVFVAGVGTGGTITGVSRYLKSRKDRPSPLLAVAVEPEACPAISDTLAGKKPVFTSHIIQGIGAGFIPATLDLKQIDRVEKVSDEEALEYARRLASEEGILSGISGGAAVAASARLAKEPGFEGKTIVVVIPDSGERYLSTGLFSGL